MFSSVTFPFSCMNTELGFIQTKKMSMPVITLNLQSKQAVSLSHPTQIAKNLQNSPFLSSYFDGSDQKSIALKLGGSKNQRNTDQELDIFDAEKYFNDKLNHCSKVGCNNLSTHDHHKKDETLPIRALSIHSESSSNSRSALLNSILPRKGLKKSFLATFGCNCSCVDTDEHTSVYGKSKQVHVVRKSKSTDYKCGVKKNGSEVELEADKDSAKRKPLHEVFGSPIMENDNKLLSMMRSSYWDEMKIASVSNDSDSDSSSDLFEIESLSKGNHFHSSSSTYAPSEASIEWSVITASAVSDLGSTTIPDKVKEIPKISCPSILSGCKSQKAVRVANDHHRFISRKPMTKF